MKTIFFFVTISIVIFFGVTPFIENYTNRNTAEVTFDGYEGGYYFFTSEKGRALQLIADDHSILEDENFENGNYIGESFDVQIFDDDILEADTKVLSSISFN